MMNKRHLGFYYLDSPTDIKISDLIEVINNYTKLKCLDEVSHICGSKIIAGKLHNTDSDPLYIISNKLRTAESMNPDISWDYSFMEINYLNLINKLNELDTSQLVYRCSLDLGCINDQSIDELFEINDSSVFISVHVNPCYFFHKELSYLSWIYYKFIIDADSTISLSKKDITVIHHYFNNILAGIIHNNKNDDDNNVEIPQYVEILENSNIQLFSNENKWIYCDSNGEPSLFNYDINN